MKISKRTISQVKLESYSPDKLFKETMKLRAEGYVFKPLETYMDDRFQNVSVFVGTKEVEWVEAKE